MLIAQLENCEKALNDFIEDKRNKFVKLSFIDMIIFQNFLSNCKDNGVIKNNLRKLYKGINTLTINNDNKISDILSVIGEKVV